MLKQVTRGWLTVALMAATLFQPGCGGRMHRVLAPRALPEVRLTVRRQAPSAGDSIRFQLSWDVASAGTGVDHYVYCVDPPSLEVVDRNWHVTRDKELALAWPAHARGDSGEARPRPAPAHAFAVRAVDAAGRLSPPAVRMLTATNVPPFVNLLVPIPSMFYAAIVPTSVRLSWTGTDPDGVFTQKPWKYKFRIFSQGTNEFTYDAIIADPDSLRRLYAPGYAGWDSCYGDTTSVPYSNLVPNATYLFAVVGFDEQGATNEPFSLTTNMTQLRVAFPCTSGPRLTFFNQSFYYQFLAGGCMTDPSYYPRIELPADRSVTMQWLGTPNPGAVMARYRWAVDIANLDDETPRTDEGKDWRHWSQWSLNTTSATFGPFDPPGLKRQSHVFYAEAEDDLGLRSIAGVRFLVERPTFTNDLLIVNDTRFRPDQLVSPVLPDTVRAPTGPWPTAAELDTFLFARGGVRWRSTPNGTLSPPGIFAGYHYDTIGTSTLPGHIVPLAVLTQYRQVIWLTDVNGATFTSTGSVNPITGLRAQTSPTQQDVLAAYVQQGGKLWLLGGGAGLAATINWNRTGNDVPGPYVFSSTPVGGYSELGTGRLMYDFVHWETGFTTHAISTLIPILRNVSGSRTGGPNFDLLPAALTLRSPATDPLPPLRIYPDFYNQTSRGLEFLSEPMFTDLENVGWPGGAKYCGHTMDTLFVASGTGLPPAPAVNPVMTHYHAHDAGSVLFSGFDFWSFQRSQCIQLVDFVLQSEWRLSRDPVSRGVVASPMALRPAHR